MQFAFFGTFRTSLFATENEFISPDNFMRILSYFFPVSRFR